MIHPVSTGCALARTIEILEARIAPAAVFVNATTATYNDNDGDHVTVKFSKPVLTAGNVPAIFDFNAAGYLDTLSLATAIAPGGTGIAFTVVKVAGGDGLVNVGFIKAIGVDLGAVTLPGDLGKIAAGDATPATAGVKSLAVRSLGLLGSDTGGGNLVSGISGALNALTVKGDVKDASLIVTGGGDGKIGAITIGGSLLGGATTKTGYIEASGNIGAVKIGHDVQGGSGDHSGYLVSFLKFTSITIGGSLIGGGGDNSGYLDTGGEMGPVKITHDLQGNSGADSGEIYCGTKLTSVTIGGSLNGGTGEASGSILTSHDAGPIKIGHDLQGGVGVSSGEIDVDGNLGSVTIGGSFIGGAIQYSGEITSGLDMGMVKIGHDLWGGSAKETGEIDCEGKLAGVSIGGSLIGGTGLGSGQIYSKFDLGPVTIGHNLTGGSVTGMDTLDSSGLILSTAHITSVTIGGSIIAGTDNSSKNQAGGDLTDNASIIAGEDIGSITVKGGIVGNSSAGGITHVLISAYGQATPGATADIAIGKVSVGGRVSYTLIEAGYDYLLAPKNADAQIGAVSVGGDWTASSIAAGANQGAFGFGAGDAIISGAGTQDATGLFSKIASITIAGQVFGTPSNVGMFDQFGFVAEEIGALKIGGSAFPLTAGKHNDTHAIGQTLGDMHIHEI